MENLLKNICPHCGYYTFYNSYSNYCSNCGFKKTDNIITISTDNTCKYEEIINEKKKL